MNKPILHLCALALCAVLGAAQFVTAAAAEPDAAAARAAIATKFPGVKPNQIRSSPVAGVYEVEMGADTAYVSADGKYLFSGDLYEVESRTNLTEAGRVTARSRALAKLDEKDLIVFGAPDSKYTINVFTDVECGYCRKLHSQIDQLTQLGIRVRYLAYPRAGPNTEDWQKMETVWCAKDRNAALTKAKLGQSVQAAKCATPIAKQYALGEELGVRGTPAIFTPGGEYIGGYIPPKEMAQQLAQLQAATLKKGK